MKPTFPNSFIGTDYSFPADVDGVEEENTPMVPPHGRIRYQFTPRPAGTRWYHTHTMAGADLHRGAYTGQFGFLMIESANNPGNYDQEIFLALREWEPFFNPEEEDDDDASNSGPQPERPKMLDTNPSGLEVGYQMFSINDKAMGAGEPIRVQPGQKVLMHLLNASASMNRRIALAGHKFQIIAMDGNPVPTPQSVDVIYIGPGERVDAIVEMNQPGVWILGTDTDDVRNGGMGVLIEYANQHKQPQWVAPAKSFWDYTIFGRAGTQPPPDATIDMIFQKIPSGAGLFNSWTVNGKEYPHDQEFVLKQGGRYRLVFRNRSEDDHPLHMHRHSFEIVEINGKATSGSDERYRNRSRLRPRHGRHGGRSARANAVSLPHSAAHGLRVQSPVSLRLIGTRRLITSFGPVKASAFPWPLRS